MKIKFIESVDRVSGKRKVTEIVLRNNLKKDRFVLKRGKELLEIGIGKKKEINRRRWIILVRKIVRLAKSFNLKRILLRWDDLIDFPNLTKDDLGRLFAEAVLMADYDFRRYKKEPKKGWSDLEEMFLLGVDDDSRKSFRKGEIVAKRLNYARELSNISGGDLTPVKLVREIEKVIKGTDIKLRVFGENDLRKMKMNGILAVGQGSQEPSRFIVMEYKKAKNKKERPIVLVGKGVTFDSGGIDTKPHPHGLDMMMDMSGAASVLATLLALNDLRVKKNIFVLIPAVENMPSGSSMRPGDVIKMHNGLHVEIGHTDAEGRLILADALSYAEKFKPQMVIDVATLTGAAVVALGTKATALMTRDEKLAQDILEVSEKTGDYVWRLPLWEEYEKDIVATRGDIANVNTKAKSGGGGAITAGIFLWYFAKKHRKWAHLDIAPRMVSGPEEQLGKGAGGPAVRLLVKLLED